MAKPRAYPLSMPPGPNADRYPVMNQAAENFFDLRDPFKPKDEKPDKPDDKPGRNGVERIPPADTSIR